MKESEKSEIVRKFEQYIAETDIPILAEFAYQNDVTRPWMYLQTELLTLIKKCMDKKESALERKALKEEVNTTMAIFSLKQLGWRDKEAKVVFVDPKTLSDEDLKKLIQDGG